MNCGNCSLKQKNESSSHIWKCTCTQRNHSLRNIANDESDQMVSAIGCRQ